MAASGAGTARGRGHSPSRWAGSPEWQPTARRGGLRPANRGSENRRAAQKKGRIPTRSRACMITAKHAATVTAARAHRDEIVDDRRLHSRVGRRHVRVRVAHGKGYKHRGVEKKRRAGGRRVQACAGQLQRRSEENLLHTGAQSAKANTHAVEIRGDDDGRALEASASANALTAPTADAFESSDAVLAASVTLAPLNPVTCKRHRKSRINAILVDSGGTPPQSTRVQNDKALSLQTRRYWDRERRRAKGSPGTRKHRRRCPHGDGGCVDPGICRDASLEKERRQRACEKRATRKCHEAVTRSEPKRAPRDQQRTAISFAAAAVQDERSAPLTVTEARTATFETVAVTPASVELVASSTVEATAASAAATEKGCHGSKLRTTFARTCEIARNRQHTSV